MRRDIPILPVILILAAASASMSCKPKESPAGGDSGTAVQEVPDGSYVLVNKEYAPKPGTVRELGMRHEMTGGTFAMEAQERKVEGTMDMQETESVRLEALAEDRVKVVIGKHERKQTMKIGGREMPQPPKSKPLVGVPVLLTRSGGTWSAAREDGRQPTAEEKKEMDGLVERIDSESDLAIYGKEPRKPGDTWTVKGANLPFLDQLENPDGEMTVTFDKVGFHEGIECAFFSGTLKVTGNSADAGEGAESTITMAGTYKAIRSLEHLEDLLIDIDAKMDLEIKMPAGTMTVQGPAKTEIITTVK